MKFTLLPRQSFLCPHVLLSLLLFTLAACAPNASPAQLSTVTPVAEAESTDATATIENTTTITEPATMTNTATMTSSTAADGQSMLPAEMIGVIWQWQDERVTDPSRYTMEFMADGRVAVQADCNRGTGTYQIVGQAFFIEVLALTRAACGPDSLEQPFLEQVNSTDTYRLEGDVLVLTLRVAPGMTTFTPTEGSTANGAPTITSPGEGELIDAAAALVATETGVDSATLTMSAIEAVEWGDSSLGCPAPGMMYMQVITPGYRIIFQDDAGMTYEVHTAGDTTGAMVYCAQTEETMSSELDGMLTGSVMYRQRIALPAGSVVTVELQDVSRADAAATILATATITTSGENVPIPFTLSYDPAQIDPRFNYAVRAQIQIDGQLRWTSTERYSVLTKGNPTADVTILLMPTQ